MPQEQPTFRVYVNDDQAHTGPVYEAPTPPHFDHSVAKRGYMSMAARANAVHVADIELTAISSAESMTRAYMRLKELADIEPELLPTYMRLFKQIEGKLLDVLNWAPHRS